MQDKGWTKKSMHRQGQIYILKQSFQVTFHICGYLICASATSGQMFCFRETSGLPSKIIDRHKQGKQTSLITTIALSSILHTDPLMEYFIYRKLQKGIGKLKKEWVTWCLQVAFPTCAGILNTCWDLLLIFSGRELLYICRIVIFVLGLKLLLYWIKHKSLSLGTLL